VVYRCPAVCVMRISSDGSVNPAHAPIFFGAQDVGFWDGPDLSLSATASTMSLTPMIATNPIGSEGFLLLSNTGLQVLYVSHKQREGERHLESPSEISTVYESQKSWTLPIAASRILPSQRNCYSCVVYATVPAGVALNNGTANFSFSDQSSANYSANADGSKVSSQKVILSDPGLPTINLSYAGREFILDEGEVVLEMKWQPVPKYFEASASENYHSSTWQYSAGSTANALPTLARPQASGQASFKPLLAVLTSRRILLFSVGNVLLLLNTYRPAKQINSPIPRQPSAFSPPIPTVAEAQESVDRVMSISWVGLTVLFTCVSGRVGYLLPASPLQHLLAEVSEVSAQAASRDHRLRQHLLLQEQLRLAGLNMRNLDQGVLCYLPRQLFGAETCKVVAVLPDRVLFAAQQQMASDGTSSAIVNAGAFNRVQPTLRVVVRPLCVSEPLLLGLLASFPAPLAVTGAATASALEGVSSEPTSLAKWSELILKVVVNYYAANAENTNASSGEGGAIPSGHSTAKLCLSLSYAANRVARATAGATASSEEALVFKNLLLASVAAVAGCVRSGSDARYRIFIV
jgi:hypothetical protein